MGLIQDRQGNYQPTGTITEQDILSAAETLLRAKLERPGSISNPQDAGNFLRMRLEDCDTKSSTSSGSTTATASSTARSSLRAPLTAPASIPAKSSEPPSPSMPARSCWRTTIRAGWPNRAVPIEASLRS